MEAFVASYCDLVRADLRLRAAARRGAVRARHRRRPHRRRGARTSGSPRGQGEVRALGGRCSACRCRRACWSSSATSSVRAHMERLAATGENLSRRGARSRSASWTAIVPAGELLDAGRRARRASSPGLSPRPRTRRSSCAPARRRSPGSTRRATTIRFLDFWFSEDAQSRIRALVARLEEDMVDRGLSESPSSMPLPLDEILEALDLSRAEPGAGFLERLFVALQRARPVRERLEDRARRRGRRSRGQAAPARSSSGAEHLESGTGGTCFARVAAFDALLDGARLPERAGSSGASGRTSTTRRSSSRRTAGRIVRRRLPAAGAPAGRRGEVETPLGRGAGRRRRRAASRIDLGGVPEGPRGSSSSPPRSRTSDYEASGARRSGPARISRGGRAAARPREPAFSVSRAGAVRVDDLHSRLAVPLPAPRAAALAELFGVDRGAASSGRFARVGDPEPDERRRERSRPISRSRRAPERGASRRSRRPTGYRRLLEGVAEVRRGGRGAGRISAAAASRRSGGGSGRRRSALEDRVVVDRERRAPATSSARRDAARSILVFAARASADGRTYLAARRDAAGRARGPPAQRFAARAARRDARRRPARLGADR